MNEWKRGCKGVPAFILCFFLVPPCAFQFAPIQENRKPEICIDLRLQSRYISWIDLGVWCLLAIQGSPVWTKQQSRDCKELLNSGSMSGKKGRVESEQTHLLCSPLLVHSGDLGIPFHSDLRIAHSVIGTSSAAFVNINTTEIGEGKGETIKEYAWM